MKKLVVVSLFDGLSGGRIALDRAGIKVLGYYSSEIDKYALQIAKKNYNSNVLLGDVKNIDVIKLKKDIQSEHGEDVKILLIGGSPCQNFSMIGKRKGSSTSCGIDVVALDQYLKLKKDGFEFDGQSYLFWEFIRIKEGLKPDFYMLENVRLGKKWQEMFNQALNHEYLEINSNLVSAQDRIRFYWIGEKSGDKYKKVDVSQPIDCKVYFHDIVEDLPFRELKPFMFNKWGDKKRVDRSRSVKAKKSFTLTTSRTHTLQYYLNEDRSLMRLLSIREREVLQTIPMDYTLGVSDTQRAKMISNGWTIDVVAHIFKEMLK